MAEIRSFAGASIVVQRGSQCVQILLGQQIVSYNPSKQQKMAEITSFADVPIVVYSHGIEILSGQQIVGHKPRKQQKWPKSRVLPMPRYSCKGGHRASKSRRDHKSWVIAHENGKNGRNHEFCRCLDSRVSGGHSASKSSRDHKSWVITHENVKNGRNHEFCRCLDSHVLGVIVHRNPPETINLGL